MTTSVFLISRGSGLTKSRYRPCYREVRISSIAKASCGTEGSEMIMTDPLPSYGREQVKWMVVMRSSVKGIRMLRTFFGAVMSMDFVADYRNMAIFS